MSSANEDRSRSFRTDRDRHTYARRRAQQARRRVALEHASFDPSAPADDDWVIEDRSQLRRLPSGPESLAGLLDDVVSNRKWGERIRSTMVFSRWDEVVGTELAQHCEPVRLVGGVLTVSVTDTAWATQLRYLARRVILNVNQALDEPLVDDLNVIVRATRS